MSGLRGTVENALTNLEERTVTLGGTTFKIQKLLPMEAYQAFEMIRAELGEKLGRYETEEGQTLTVPDIILAILKLAPEKVDEVRRALFAGVTFTNERAETPMRLAGDENMAFEKLEPIDIYEVFVRCLAINFTGSLTAVLSKVEGLTG